MWKPSRKFMPQAQSHPGYKHPSLTKSKINALPSTAYLQIQRLGFYLHFHSQGSLWMLSKTFCNYLSMDEDVVYIQWNIFSATNREKEILPFSATWKELYGIVLNEISQPEKAKYCMMPFF